MPSNVLYPTFKEALLKGSIDLDSSTVYVTLVSSSYTYSATDEFYSTSITAYQVGNTGTLINKSFINITTNGSDIEVLWNSSGLFSL